MSRFYLDDIWADGYRVLMRGVLLLGGALLVLGTLIFLFPALIGILVATLILFAGMVILFWGYQLWRFKKQVKEMNTYSGTGPQVHDVSSQGSDEIRRRITVILR